MSSYLFTPQAVEDLFEIWRYVAADDLDAANRVEQGLHDACARLADAPLAGAYSRRFDASPTALLAGSPLQNLLDCL